MSIGRLSARALNRAYLARQQLLARERTDPATLVRRLTALQGQAVHPPYTALWCRIEGVSTEAIDSLLRSGELVRLALFRLTIHMIPGDQVHPLRTITRALMERGFPPPIRDALVAVDRQVAAARMRAVTEQRPMTWSELGRAVEGEFDVREASGYSTDQVLPRIARNLLPMVAAPPSMLWGDGTPGRYRPHSSADHAPLEQARVVEVRRDLVRRFVSAYGPTSAAALTAFTGISGWPREFRELADEFIHVDGPDGMLVDLPDAPRPDEDTCAPVRLMAEWDSALHTRTDAARLVPAAAKPLLYSKNGLMPATVLIDGLVDGTWKFSTSAKLATLRVLAASRWTEQTRHDVEQEALRYLDFAAPGQPAAVHFD